MYIGLIASVAQTAAGSAPNAVSIATAVNNAGNHFDDACYVSSGAGCPNAEQMHQVQGAGASAQWSTVDSGTTRQISVDSDATTIQNFDGCSSNDLINIKGYLRATNATSFQWTVTVDSSSLSNSCSVAMGTNSTAQDCTGGTNANTCTMTFGGGRGGLAGPADGDHLHILVRAAATNAAGTTIAAPKCRIIWNYVEL